MKKVIITDEEIKAIKFLATFFDTRARNLSRQAIEIDEIKKQYNDSSLTVKLFLHRVNESESL